MLSLAVPAPRLTGWIWKNVSAFTFPHCLFTFFIFLFFTLFSQIKVSRPPRTINHRAMRLHRHRYGDPTVGILTQNETFYFHLFFIFFVRAVHLLPLQLLFDGVMEKANWTSGEETKSRFLWWKPEVSTGCRTSKLHFPATHFTTLYFLLVRVRARARVCAPNAWRSRLRSRDFATSSKRRRQTRANVRLPEQRWILRGCWADMKLAASSWAAFPLTRRCWHAGSLRIWANIQESGGDTQYMTQPRAAAAPAASYFS